MPKVIPGFFGAFRANDRTLKPQSTTEYQLYIAPPASGFWTRYWWMRSNDNKHEDKILLFIIPYFIIRRFLYTSVMFIVCLIFGIFIIVTIPIVVSVAVVIFLVVHIITAMPFFGVALAEFLKILILNPYYYFLTRYILGGFALFFGSFVWLWFALTAWLPVELRFVLKMANRKKVIQKELDSYKGASRSVPSKPLHKPTSGKYEFVD